MKLIVLILLLIVGAALFGYQYSTSGMMSDDQDGKLLSVNAEEFSTLVAEGGSTILDVRTGDEFGSGHIAGAVNSDFYNTVAFSSFLDGLDKNESYLIYCRSGSRSGSTLKMMRDKGFTQVTDLSGGIASWEAAGLPLE